MRNWKKNLSDGHQDGFSPCLSLGNFANRAKNVNLIISFSEVLQIIYIFPSAHSSTLVCHNFLRDRSQRVWGCVRACDIEREREKERERERERERVAISRKMELKRFFTALNNRNRLLSFEMCF